MSEKELLPCFKPADWEGAPACVGRRFTVGDVDSEHLPWLAFGYDRPHAFEFLRPEALASLGRSAAEAEADALRNIRARPVRWEKTSLKLGEDHSLELVVAIDDYFAAEKILDADFMAEGGRLLDTSALAVGIPCRGVLLATQGKQNMELLGAFAAAVSAQYHHPQSPPITPAVFALLDGDVVGMLQGGEALGAGGSAPDAQEDDAPDYYVGGLVIGDRTTGLDAVHICAGGPNIATLGPAIESAFRQTLEGHASRDGFGGVIRVVIFNGMTPEPVRAQLPSLEAHLKGTLAELGLTTPGGHPVTVEFEYHEGEPAS